MIKDYQFSQPENKESNPRKGLGRRILPAMAIVLAIGFSSHFVNQAEGHVDTNQQMIQRELPLPAHPVEITRQSAETAETIEVSAPAETIEDDSRWVEHKISSGESLATIFKAQGLSARLLHTIVHSSDTAAKLAAIRPGEQLRFQFDGDDNLKRLVLERSPIESLQITANDDRFEAQEVEKEVEIRHNHASGSIQASLFVDGQEAGLSDAQIMEMAGIFGWDIDFALELREGDSFSVIYEEHYLDGNKFRDGPIIAAEFINKGTTYRAVRYTDSKGDTSYYDPDGRNKKRAFIRTPVKFARISSGFSKKRYHPVLKKTRAHRGVDYAAPTGTPVKATGNGTVTFRGKQGGYGNVLFVKHGGTYTTVYGHLSRFAKGIGKGSKVKQGQVIAYVGATGVATGPHLHYEFRVNGVHRNPLTVELPKSDPLPESEMAAFQQKTETLVAQLDLFNRTTLLAKADK